MEPLNIARHYSPKWNRIIAQIVDLVIISLVSYICNASSLQVSIFNIYLIMLGYFFLSELIWDRTFGKFITGIVIVDSENMYYNEKTMFRKVFIRTLCRLIPFDLLSFFFTENKQLWHDNLSKTKVINAKYLDKKYFHPEASV